MGSYTAIGLGGQQAHIEKLAEPLYQRPNKRTVSFDPMLVDILTKYACFVCKSVHVSIIIVLSVR